MTAFSRVSVFCVALSALSIFAGCSNTGHSNKSNNWLIGKWCYDMEMTKANMPGNIQIRGVPDSKAKETGELLTTQLMNQMNNVKFHITSERFTTISEDGTRKSGSYEIIERPDKNTIVLEGEGEDGNVSTFSKSAEHICLLCTGAVQSFNLYFRISIFYDRIN